MSRITKEEIEKTKCGRFLLSDENIYLSIYSFPKRQLLKNLTE